MTFLVNYCKKLLHKIQLNAIEVFHTIVIQNYNYSLSFSSGSKLCATFLNIANHGGNDIISIYRN